MALTSKDAELGIIAATATTFSLDTFCCINCDGEVTATVVLWVTVGTLDTMNAPFVGPNLNRSIKCFRANLVLWPKIRAGHEALGKYVPTKEFNSIVFVPLDLGDAFRARNILCRGPYLALRNS